MEPWANSNSRISYNRLVKRPNAASTTMTGTAASGGGTGKFKSTTAKSTNSCTTNGLLRSPKNTVSQMLRTNYDYTRRKFLLEYTWVIMFLSLCILQRWATSIKSCLRCQGQHVTSMKDIRWQLLHLKIQTWILVYYRERNLQPGCKLHNYQKPEIKKARIPWFSLFRS